MICYYLKDAEFIIINRRVMVDSHGLTYNFNTSYDYHINVKISNHTPWLATIYANP